MTNEKIEGKEIPGKPGFYWHYRNDMGKWEVICPHGIGHDKGTHGCDGCCSQLSEEDL